MSGIYIIENLVNNKIYLGSSLNIDRRFTQHISKLKLNKHYNIHLQSSWNKYGMNNFRFLKIACIDKNNVKLVEQMCLDVLDLKYSYNLNKNASGGDHGYPQSGENNKRHRKISVFDLEMNFLEEISGLRATERKYNTRSIYSCCIGRSKQINGFIFKYSK